MIDDDLVKPEAAPPATCTLVTVPLFHLSGLYACATMMLTVGAKTVYRCPHGLTPCTIRVVKPFTKSKMVSG